ncbi:Galacturonosyltransferase 8 [Ancistrocladus abbreviatus]
MTFVIIVAIALFSLSLLFTSHFGYSTADAGSATAFIGVESIRRSVLALKSDPLKPRIDQLKKQADDHPMLALAYASYAHKLKLENSKMLRIFADLSRNYSDLLNRPPYRTLFESDSISINESLLRQFEKEVKERIKVTRQMIAEAKESFDNQLKSRSLRTLFSQLTNN